MTTTAPPLDALRALARPKPKKDDHAQPAPDAIAALSVFKRLAEAKRAQKDAEALVKSLQADCIAIAEPHRVAMSKQQGKNLSSLALGDLVYIHQNRYSAIKDLSDEGSEDEPGPTLEQRVEELRAIFGKDFDLYFLETMQISVDASKLSPEQIEMLAQMDPEVVRAYKPTTTLHNDRTLRPGVLEMCDLANVRPVSYFKKA